MKHHGNYNTQSPFDIGVGITTQEREYVGFSINELRHKGRNDRRKREKDRAKKYNHKKRERHDNTVQGFRQHRAQGARRRKTD